MYRKFNNTRDFFDSYLQIKETNLAGVSQLGIEINAKATNVDPQGIFRVINFAEVTFKHLDQDIYYHRIEIGSVLSIQIATDEDRERHKNKLLGTFGNLKKSLEEEHGVKLHPGVWSDEHPTMLP